jgi:6-phosphogluconolactonase
MGIDADVVVAGDLAAWIDAAVGMFLEAAEECLEERNKFVVSLAGGTTPKQVYEQMALDARVQALDWSRIFVVFGDERCVPPSDSASNFHMANAALLSHVPIPKDNVLRMRGEDDPASAAVQYAGVLSTLLGGLPDTGRPPHEPIDLSFLGLGTNGHTASLFPGLPWSVLPDEWVIGQYVEVASTWRLTLTPLVLNEARRTVFLVEGPAKASVVAQVLEGPLDPVVLPSQNIVRATWLLDDAAASQLHRP